MDAVPFVSIIIPVYQAEDYIEACLNSIASQDYSGKIECILVDDCGKDASMAKVRHFVEGYHGSITFHILNHKYSQGAAAARNTGLRFASGDYIFFVDSDDYLTPDALSILSAPLSSTKYDMVLGRCMVSGLYTKKDFSLPYGTILRGSEILYSYLDRQISVTVWNKLIKASFIQDNQLFFYEGIVCEDDLWSFQAYVLADSVYVVDKITYYYITRKGSVMTATPLKRRADNYKTFLCELYHFVVMHHLESDRQLHNWFERNRLGVFRFYLDDKKSFKDAYISSRSLIHKSWLNCVIMNGFHPLKQIRDLHLAFPARCGVWYCFLYVKLRFHKGDLDCFFVE